MGRNRVNRSEDTPTVWDAFNPSKWGWEIWFLAAIPVAAGGSLLHAPAVFCFAASSVAIIPLAGLMGRGTEALADRLGPGIGGLLNATFGNAAELILALFALSRGLDEVVKASLTGSIIGNLLLVFGASLLAGGIKYPVQQFNRTMASSSSTLMVLASVGMLIPALFHGIHGSRDAAIEHKLSFSVSLVLICTYALSLLFSLVTHKSLFAGAGEATPAQKPEEAAWTIRKATGVLLTATAFVAWMSEILVGAVEEASHALGMNQVFMGVIVVAIVGNAAEHSTAILMALKNQMDLAVGIAIGSALQVALFVAPVLVFASYLRPTHGPMDLLFSTFEVVAMIIAAIVARMAAEDGESNWLEGAMLLMLYVILAIAFFLIPNPVLPTA